MREKSHTPARQVRKGLLELAVLFALNERERYSRDLILTLSSVGIHMTEGTLYPLLSRLRRLGLVGYYPSASRRGPARKYYYLTETGYRHAMEQWDEWQVLNQGIITLIEKQQNNGR